MISLADFKRGPDFAGWLRAPQAEKFVQQLQAQVADAATRVLGAASVSADPQVRAAHAEWKVLSDLTTFLANGRKESAEDDE